jgi:peptide/nickel transport system permease protein
MSAATGLGAGQPTSWLLRRARSGRHPIVRLVAVRLARGVLTLWAVTVVIFLATQALPGNAAYAVLGHTATPQRLHALEQALHLNRALVSQYGSWIGGVLHGDFGASLANGEKVSTLIGPRLVNSATLVVAAGIIGTLVAGVLGLIAAARRDSVFDDVTSVVLLAITGDDAIRARLETVGLPAADASRARPAKGTR